MRNYEVTFIVDPVLSSEEIQSTATNYQDHLKKQGCTIVHVDEMGLRQLAYPISKRTSGIYYCVEFQTDSGNVIEGLELALRRDERIMRFLTVKLDKYGVKYNDDKRKGLIGRRQTETATSTRVTTKVATPVAAATKMAPPVTAAATAAVEANEAPTAETVSDEEE